MKTLNLDYLNEQFDNDKECIDEILNIFIDSADETMASINKALETKNEKELSTYAHKLKGASGTIGAEILSNQCFIVDKLCKEDNYAEALNEATKIPPLYIELRKVLTT